MHCIKKLALVNCYFLVLKDSDQSDKDRQADENNNKHKQDIYDHGYSDQKRDSDSKREDSKRSENSQRENDQRQVALRDSSENRGLEGRDTGVQVVSPTENSTNKWANIIKVNFSNYVLFGPCFLECVIVIYLFCALLKK